MITARHTVAYVTWRDSKIPRAVAEADAECPEPAPTPVARYEAWQKHWTAAFHRSMGRLTDGSLEVN